MKTKNLPFNLLKTANSILYGGGKNDSRLCPYVICTGFLYMVYAWKVFSLSRAIII